MKKSSILIILFFLTACDKDARPVISVLIDDPKISRAENTIYYNGKRFSGVIRTSHGDVKNQLIMEVKNGLMDGRYQEWNDTYQIITDRQYKEGLEHGIQKGYNADGTVLYEYKCLKGERIGSIIEPSRIE